MNFIFKGLVVIIAVALFVFSYLLNQRTKIPSDCEKISNCQNCNNSKCYYRKNNGSVK